MPASTRRGRVLGSEARSHCDVIVRRWQAWTGEIAVLEGDGQSFEEIAAGRAAVAA
jgi:hypothetical protein